MAWLREEVVRVEKQVEEAKKRRRLLENDLRILDKRLEQERQRLIDIDERRQESVLALHAAQRQDAEHGLVNAGDEATTEEPSRAPAPQEEKAPEFVSMTRAALKRVEDEIAWAEPARIDDDFEIDVRERYWHVTVAYLRTNGPHSAAGLEALEEGLCCRKYRKLGDWWGQAALENYRNTYSLERDNTLPVFRLHDTSDTACKVLTIMVHVRDIRTDVLELGTLVVCIALYRILETVVGTN